MKLGLGTRCLAATAVLVVASAIASNARADAIDFFLTQGECPGDHCTGTNAPAPIAASNADAVEVIVTLTNSSFTGDVSGPDDFATVEFVGLNNGTTNIDTPAFINVNATSFGATVSIPGGVVTGEHPEDSQGDFNLETGAVSAGTVTFDLTDESGSWADAAAVLIGNGPQSGYPAFPNGFEADTAAQFAGIFTPAAPVPEPSTLVVLGTALLGFGWMLRRKGMI